MRQLEGAPRTKGQRKILSLDTLEEPRHSSFPPGRLAHASKSHNYDFWKHAPGLQEGTGRAHDPDRRNQAPWKNLPGLGQLQDENVGQPKQDGVPGRGRTEQDKATRPTLTDCMEELEYTRNCQNPSMPLQAQRWSQKDTIMSFPSMRQLEGTPGPLASVPKPLATLNAHGTHLEVGHFGRPRWNAILT